MPDTLSIEKTGSYGRSRDPLDDITHSTDQSHSCDPTGDFTDSPSMQESQEYLDLDPGSEKIGDTPSPDIARDLEEQAEKAAESAVDDQRADSLHRHNSYPIPPLAGLTLQRTLTHRSRVSRLSHHSEEQSGDQSGNVMNSETPALPGHVTQDHLSQTRRYLICFMLCVCTLLVAIDETIITTALPEIVAALKSSSGYTWIGTSYLLACASSMPAYGALADIFGRKPIILLSIALFLIGSAIAGAATDMGMMISGRVIQGIGGGGISNLVNVIVADIIDLKYRGTFMGAIGATWAVGGCMGPLLGGAFASGGQWRWCFFLNLPIAGVCFIFMAWLANIKSPPTTLRDGLKRIDFLGIILITCATVCLFLALDWGGVHFAWNSAPVIVCLVLSGVLYIAFVLCEKYIPNEPVMPPRLFTNFSRTGALLCTFFHSTTFMAVSYFTPFMYQSVYNKSPIGAAVYLLPQAIVMGLASAISGYIITKTGKYKIIMIVGFSLAAIFNGMIVTLNPDSNTAKQIMWVTVWGIGIGPNFESTLIALHTHIKSQDIATATSTWGFLRTIGFSIGIAIGGVVFQNKMQTENEELGHLLPADLRELLTGADAAASTTLIKNYSEPVQKVAKLMYSRSFKDMFWTCLGLCLGYLFVFLIKERPLEMKDAKGETTETEDEVDQIVDVIVDDFEGNQKHRDGA